ncbi:uncharacterized protein N7511_001037 [Penicillium nucicola]|uniref:uncharacterized protein n=1 Tax=Penicillium nucicola TaxID=1850975 RepID=UPI002544F4C4|nr:uncharacterized protein N7511_001037 [Penicillium nucicola]KAJ5776026.1 hypothetical protein N7511_001037 [Penicillium nucicola]
MDNPDAMASPGTTVRGATSGAPDIWGRPIDRTYLSANQSDRGRIDPREPGYIRESEYRNDVRGPGRARNRRGSAYYQDLDLNGGQTDRNWYRRRLRSSNSNSGRGQELGNRRGRKGVGRNEQRRCFICDTPGHVARHHNAWALSNQGHAAGSIGMTDPVVLSINSEAHMSILPHTIAPRTSQQQEQTPVDITALIAAWEQYLAPGLTEVEDALTALQTTAVRMGVTAPHAEISGMVSLWDRLINPGRIRMESSLAAMCANAEGAQQEGCANSSTTSAPGNQEEPSSDAAELMDTTSGAADGSTGLIDEYDFNTY